VKREHIFLIAFGLVFAALAVIFLALPRSTYSALEKRDLARVPAFSRESLLDGTYTAGISHWFSDTEPMRDRFMTGSMIFRELLAVRFGPEEEIVTFHASGAPAADATPERHVPTEAELQAAERNIGEYDNHAIDEDGVAKVANNGIIVVGSGDNVRAMMVFGGGAEGASPFARAVNHYSANLPDVQVYGMVIPTAIEFYCPKSVRNHTRSQRAAINNMYSQLDSAVRAVDVYTTLGQHADRDIYLRTDHHWAPLGAYYAAAKFAAVARVPFRGINRYDRKVVHGYVGTMYAYSKDISVKHAPEDFVYYTPRDSAYTTTYIDFTLDSAYHIKSESRPYNGRFFHKFKDGSGAAYQTLMGGDMKLVKVVTGSPGPRRLLIIKDSFGNALPGWLFGSFEQIHVVDFRYFNRDMRQYITDNKVTDLLIVLNSFNAYSSGVSRKIERLLH